MTIWKKWRCQFGHSSQPNFFIASVPSWQFELRAKRLPLVVNFPPVPCLSRMTKTYLVSRLVLSLSYRRRTDLPTLMTS